MRADEDVDLPLLNLLDNFFLLLRGTEAAKHLNGDRESCEAALEGFEMLEGKNSRWRKDRNLAVVLNGFERGAHSDFSFAVADISTEQAIHRHRGLHILLDVSYGGDLIVSFVVIEGILEFPLPLRIL